MYNPIGNDVLRHEDTVDGKISPDKDIEANNTFPSYFDMARDTVKSFGTYTAAALAVGIGFAYTYFKQQ